MPNPSMTINGQPLLKLSAVRFVKPMEWQKLLQRLASVLPGGCTCGLKLGGWKLSKTFGPYLMVSPAILYAQACLMLKCRSSVTALAIAALWREDLKYANVDVPYLSSDRWMDG